MKKYKKLIIAIFVILLFYTTFSYAACIRTPLPIAAGRTIIVETVDQLHKAVYKANKNGKTTIFLKDGHYLLEKPLIIKGKNISVRSYLGDSEDVIIKGKGMRGEVTHIFLVQNDNFVLADLTIGWVKHHAIQVHGEKGVKNVTIHNVHFVNTGQQMLKVSTSSKNKKRAEKGLVEWSSFKFTDGFASQSYTGGIDAHNAIDWIVRNNHFSGIKSPDKGLAEHAIHFWNGSENTLVEKNVITNSDRGIGFGLGKKGHTGGIIRNNMVLTNRDIGIGLESSPGTQIYNNTVFTENYGNSIEYRFLKTKEVIIQNNLVNKNISSRNGGQAKLSNNIDYANKRWFVNSEKGDLHLRTGLSNIVDQGRAITGQIHDIDCDIKFKGHGVDIGADEYQGEINKNIKIKPPSKLKKAYDDSMVFAKRLGNYVQNNYLTNDSSSGNIPVKQKKIETGAKFDTAAREYEGLDDLPLILIDNLEYIGGFRIKSGTYGESRTGYSVGKIAYNSDSHSIFLAGHAHHNAIAEFKIPKVVLSEKLKDLNLTPEPVQSFAKVLHRTDTGNTQKLDKIGGMEYIKGELLVHAYEYYDGNNNNNDTTLVVRDAGNLENSNIDGFFKFSGKAHEVLWVSPIPNKLQTLFGGDYLSGASSAIPINGRSSMGPSAFVLNSKDIINNQDTNLLIDTKKVLDFSLSHIMSQTKSGWLSFADWRGAIQYNYSGKRPAGKAFVKVYDKNLVGNNNLWTEESSAYYGLIIPGTRTYAVFGTSAMHLSGGGYKITQKNGKTCGGPCQFDPDDKYNYYWFFDVADLLEVKKGKKLSYEVKPYAYGLFEIPFKSFIQGGTFNSADEIIYFSLPSADRNQSRFEASPVIIAYKLKSKK